MANKIGDILLLFSCLFCCFLYNSLYFNVIFLTSYYSLNSINNTYKNLIDYNLEGFFLSDENSLIYIFFENTFLNINNYINYNIFIFVSTFICFFIILASICKSAQAGFHF